MLEIDDGQHSMRFSERSKRGDSEFSETKINNISQSTKCLIACVVYYNESVTIAGSDI